MVQILKSETKISSRDLAAWTGKRHDNVLRDIRNMQDAWEKVRSSKLSCQIYKVRGKEYEEFVLNKTETLYVASKWDDEMRAKLVIRWEELEAKSEQRKFARLECPEMTDALLEKRNDEGKDTKPFHYTNEMNLVNLVVLGCSAKKWREINEIPKNVPLRDTLTPVQISAIRDLQAMNTNLIKGCIEYADRKDMMLRYAKRKWADKLRDEFLRLNA